MLIPLIVQNSAEFLDLGLPLEELGPPRPSGTMVGIDLRYSADPLKAVSSLRLVPYPRTILKFCPSSSLDYRARHGPQTANHVMLMYLYHNF